MNTRQLKVVLLLAIALLALITWVTLSSKRVTLAHSEKAPIVVRWQRISTASGGMPLAQGVLDEDQVVFYVNGEIAGKGWKGYDNVLDKLKWVDADCFFVERSIENGIGPTWGNLPQVFGKETVEKLKKDRRFSKIKFHLVSTMAEVKEINPRATPKE